MAIVCWDPLKDSYNLQQRMNRLFEDSLAHTPADESQLISGAWTPLVDIYETKDTIVIRAEMPGVKEEDLSIEVGENTLTLKGKRESDEGGKGEYYHCIERSYGHFIRFFTLPQIIQQDKVCTRLENGVLEVILPKVEEAEPGSIEVSIK